MFNKDSTKWYNWTGDKMWDEYCKITGLFIILPCTCVLLFMMYLMIFGAK